MNLFEILFSHKWILSNLILGLYCIFIVLHPSLAMCGNSSDPIVLSGWSGRFSSPVLRNGQYPNGQDCRWTIEVSPGSTIRLVFYLFWLEEGYYIDGPPVDEKNCFDFVKIEDNGGETQTLCGHKEGMWRIWSKGNSISIYFHSDFDIKSLGFSATYKGVCDQGIIRENQVIASPGYPNAPPEGISCSWTVKQPKLMASIIRAIYYNQDSTTLTDLEKLPPRCGLSPFKITARNGEQTSESDVCLQNSVDVSTKELVLTYSNSKNSEPWIGTLLVVFERDVICKSVCMKYVGCKDLNVGRTDGVFDYVCDCEPGYTGKNCEAEIAWVDPCNVHNCEQGICENLPELGKRKCTCFEGYTGDSCEISACPNEKCFNGGVCTPLGQDDFKCECVPDSGYEGKLCNIPGDSAYCEQEVDTFPGSEIMWIDTLAGDVNLRPCPAGTMGNASRYCSKDASSVNKGFWTRPDLSQCISEAVYNLFRDAQNLLSTSKTPESILNITSRLANITQLGPTRQDAHNHGHERLYPGDLLMSADVIKNISVATDQTVFEEQQDEDLRKNYTNAVDNIVDPRTENIWKNARSNLVGDRVKTIVESTQRLLTSLFLKRPAFMRRMATMRQYGGGVSDSREQIEKMVYRLPLRNIDIFIGKYDENTPGSEVLLGGNTSTVALSTSVLAQWSNKTSSPSIVYVARFQSIAPLLSFTDDRNNDSFNSYDTAKIVNSDVVSADVINVTEEFDRSLERPIVLTFSLQDPRLSQNLTKKCVFLNMDATSYKDRWSGRGCVVGQSNETHVVCHCYHLTNFAVLMDVYDTQDSLDNGNDKALTYISYMGSALSILGCLITIITFQYLGLGNDRVRIHQQLGVSIILVQILFICVGITGEEHGTPLWGCRTLAITLHYCLTAMFCWMLVEGIHLYVVLVQIFDRGSHLKKYMTIGWGVPLVVVGISVGIFYNRYGTSKLCWLDHELLLVCFVPTVGLVIMINTVILAIVIRILIGSNQLTDKINQQERSTMKTSLKATGVLLPLLGLTWVLGFLSVDIGGRQVMTYVFTYLFTITNSFQGVLFFIFHCLFNVDVHLAYERRFMLKKRLSYAETISSRARKMSEPDFFSPHRLLTNSKSTITTRSTLTTLSLGGTGSSQRDKDPIIVDEVDKLPRLSMPWTNFNPAIIPEPDYHNHDAFHNDDLDDNVFQGNKTPSTTSSRKRRNTDSELGSDFMQMPKAQRNSVRFT